MTTRLLCLAAIFALMAGCAKVQPGYSPVPNPPRIPNAENVRLRVDVADGRSQRDTVSENRLRSEVDVPEFLRSSLAQELTNRGFVVGVPDIDIVVRMNVSRFFVSNDATHPLYPSRWTARVAFNVSFRRKDEMFEFSGSGKEEAVTGAKLDAALAKLLLDEATNQSFLQLLYSTDFLAKLAD